MRFKPMKKIITINIIIIYLMIFTPAFLRSIEASILFDRVVATVNNEVITWSELRKWIELENKAYLENLPSDQKEQKIKEIEKPFLNMLIDSRLQLQEAKRAGFSVSSTEINDAINDIKRKYNLTDESLKEQLHLDGLTIEEYRKRLSEQILISKIIRYEITDKIVISDERIKEYYKENAEQFSQDTRVRIRQILFTGEKAMEKAQAAYDRLLNGEDFKTLARELSKDPSSEYGGDVGYISRGNAIKEIENVAFTLNVGEVSPPFSSPKGVHIIKVEDRIEGDKLEEVREKIRQILFEREYQNKLEEWIKNLRENAYIEINL
jgi:peptidyl-prolyl cis-trans isomerase SurA